MKTLQFLLLFSFTTIQIYAQNSAKQFLNSATLKQGMQDLKGAIIDYTKVIELDTTILDAYVGRGTCHMNLGNQEEARADFLAYLEKEPMNLDLYYSVAITYLSQNNHAGALPHLDKAIQINPDYPPNRTLRGQLLSYLGYTVSACTDFLHAMQMGDEEGAKLYQKHCVNSWDSTEGYVLTWPIEEGWNMQASMQDSTYRLIEYLKKNENPDTWTEYGAMITVKGFESGTSLTEFVDIIKAEFSNRAKNIKVKIIEQDQYAAHPWMIVSMESPKTTNHKKPESQLWHITRGKQTIYGAFRAVKEKKLSPNRIREWSQFFKTGKFIEK